MILDELVLHDFGVYRGRQVFNLTPEDSERPIILIGAQNGAGKTTFLEGLQLALYGRLSHTGLRGSGGYEAYLRGAIHRLATPGEGAQVQVAFRRTVEAQERHYRLIRSWSVSSTGVKEVFEVIVDEQHDPVLTSQWAEFVEDMLPPRIAPLFFFDGEKIEQFADLKQSAEIIGVAIKGLLGLDIVERLELDLEVLERRKKAVRVSSDLRAELLTAEKDVEEAVARYRKAFEDIAASRSRRDRAAALLDRAASALKAQGGDLFTSREALIEQRIKVEVGLEGAKRDLRQWAASVAPLLMVEDLLADLSGQVERESEARIADHVLSYLAVRDERLLEILGEIPHLGLVTRVEAFLQEDRLKLSDQAAPERYLSLSSNGRAVLDTLIGSGLEDAVVERRQRLRRLQDVAAELENVERKVAAIPAPESIEPLIIAVASRDTELAAAETDLVERSQAYEATERQLAASRSRYQSRLDDHVRESLVVEDSDRIIRHSARARQTLASFKREVVSYHVHRLERLILEGLNELLRKSDLIVNVTIDPDTFEIQLTDSAWRHLSPERLSAGERQLLAVSLLWALAKASGQAAPTVIDTPLGRLDSQHRERLVQRYFPLAGDQVILLSTDEEIDQRLYNDLLPRLSRSYTVVYDPDQGGSQVRLGYAFGSNSTKVAA